jgi:hypothetical protein
VNFTVVLSTIVEVADELAKRLRQRQTLTATQWQELCDTVITDLCTNGPADKQAVEAHVRHAAKENAEFLFNQARESSGRGRSL